VINVTTEAKELLHDMLDQAEAEVGVEQEEVGIRLAPTTIEADSAAAEGGEVGLGLVLDRAQEGDQIVEHNGKRVLMVDQSIGDLLDGVTLDVVETPDGRRLTINS
jgi:Fe-S cluster assembly iron-binding protein IscA